MDKIPLKQALLWIFLWTLLISGSAVMGWLYYLHVREFREYNQQNKIIAIIQTTPDKDSLKTVYLAELLDLSVDKPTNLYRFNTREAENKLLKHPIIKEAKIKKVPPGMIFVDYCLRKPIAYIGDYTNTAIDDGGFLFPIAPFFTPKKFPVIFLGIARSMGTEQIWGKSIGECHQWRLANSLLDNLKLSQRTDELVLTRIDLSRANSKSCGQREIVLTFEEGFESASYIRVLRMNPDTYAEAWRQFLRLRPYLKPQNATIDMRISNLAFIRLLA